MTNETTADTTAKGEGGVDHAGAMRWLHAQCDDEAANERFREVRHLIDTLRAQLEAAEAEIAFARETISKSLDTEIDAGERLRMLAIRASNAIYWRDQEIQEWKARAEAAEAVNQGAEEIARIYFQIASEAIGEEAVRAKRDHEIVQVASMRARAEAAEADAASLRLDAERWRHARKLLTIDDIEGAQGRSTRSGN